MTFQRGDIIWVPPSEPDPARLRHFAIVWSEFFPSDEEFLGIMLTSSKPLTDLIIYL